MEHEDFPRGHPSQNNSRPSTLNCGVLMGSGALVLVWQHLLLHAMQSYLFFFEDIMIHLPWVPPAMQEYPIFFIRVFIHAKYWKTMSEHIIFPPVIQQRSRKGPKNYIKVKILSRKKNKKKNSIFLPHSFESSLWAFRKGITCQVWPHGLKVLE